MFSIVMFIIITITITISSSSSSSSSSSISIISSSIIVIIISITIITMSCCDASYGQFSKYQNYFCGLDPCNLKFETVRTNKQYICF